MATMTDQQQSEAVEKVLRRAEISRITRQLKTKLALASFKSKQSWQLGNEADVKSHITHSAGSGGGAQAGIHDRNNPGGRKDPGSPVGPGGSLNSNGALHFSGTNSLNASGLSGNTNPNGAASLSLNGTHLNPPDYIPLNINSHVAYNGSVYDTIPQSYAYPTSNPVLTMPQDDILRSVAVNRGSPGKAIKAPSLKAPRRKRARTLTTEIRPISQGPSEATYMASSLSFPSLSSLRGPFNPGAPAQNGPPPLAPGLSVYDTGSSSGGGMATPATSGTTRTTPETPIPTPRTPPLSARNNAEEGAAILLNISRSPAQPQNRFWPMSPKNLDSGILSGGHFSGGQSHVNSNLSYGGIEGNAVGMATVNGEFAGNSEFVSNGENVIGSIPGTPSQSGGIPWGEYIVTTPAALIPGTPRSARSIPQSARRRLNFDMPDKMNSPSRD